MELRTLQLDFVYGLMPACHLLATNPVVLIVDSYVDEGGGVLVLHGIGVHARWMRPVGLYNAVDSASSFSSGRGVDVPVLTSLLTDKAD